MDAQSTTERREGMTDLELTETATRWLGIYHSTSRYGVVFVGSGFALPQAFYPLEDRNDLDKIIQKLPDTYCILIEPPTFGIYIRDWVLGESVKFGSYPTDYARAILELVYQLQKENL
jgi:hypothetical protein